MRSTALITLLSGAVIAAAGYTTSAEYSDESEATNSLIYAPPVTTTETETITEYETITEDGPTITAYDTTYKLAPPVTVTVTRDVGELYDQSYANGYELGDVVSAPTGITETKTFSVAVPGSGVEDLTSTTKLIHVWSIKEVPAHATWPAQGHGHGPHAPMHTGASKAALAKKPLAKPTKSSDLEGSYGGLHAPEETGSKSHAEDFPVDDEEELEALIKELWEEDDEEAAEAAEAVYEEAFGEGEEKHAAPSSSSSSKPAGKPSVHYGPKPTYSPKILHHPTSFSKPKPKPSTFATKPKTASFGKYTPSKKPAAPSKPAPTSPVAAGPWKGKLANTKDGTCGPKGGKVAWTCYGNAKGTCCSEYGYCGSETLHCGKGCQSAFGNCGEKGAGSGTA